MNPYLSAVNQSLLFAGLLVRQLSSVAESRQLQLALCQSTVYQLQRAYRFHLREVAANYQCPGPEIIGDAGDLGELLVRSGKDPAEGREMTDLERRQDSWLREILDTFAGLERVQEGTESTETSDIVPLRQIERITLDEETVTGWLNQLQEMIDRHRDLMFEC